MNKSRVVLIALVGIGAAVSLALPASQAIETKSAAPGVTFTKDVAPIFFKSCAECHRPGESAPFSVLSYKDVRPWAKSIREKVVNREMPPWHADPHVGEWANDRRLRQQEIDAITAWIDGGAKEGAPSDLPAAPQFAEGWAIGKPDVVIEMPEEFTLEASGPDEYQYFDVPTNFTEDKYVQMAEARPGNRKVVHHVIAFVVPPGSPNMAKIPKEQRDKALEMALKNSPFYRDGYLIRLKPDQPVYNDINEIPPNLRADAGIGDFLTGYAPGSMPSVWNPGVAKKIPAGATIRFQVHYSKVVGSEQKDRSRIGFIFAKQAPEKTVKSRAASNIYFQIPPGAERHKVTAVYTSVEDYAKWDQALFTTKLVGADRLREAFAPGATVDKETGYGFGWFIGNRHGLKLLSHGGGTIGFTTQVRRFPDKLLTVIIMANRNNAPLSGIIDKIVDMYLPIP